jgi:hypothetical protein
MKPYNNTTELIDHLSAEVEALTKRIDALQQPPASFNEQVIFNY